MLKKLFYIAALSFLLSFTLNAQGLINGSRQICLGNLENYSYTAPSGFTVSTLNWDFGDGVSSSNTSPSHKYTASGKYTLKVEVTFTNTSTRTDSITVNVYALPKAHFYFLPATDTCMSRNSVLILDTSKAAKPNQPILYRLVLWGDGNYQSDTAPRIAAMVKHSYPNTTSFQVRVEVTDTFGCKNAMTKTITILEDIKADFLLNDTWVNCNTARIFMLNQSFGAPDSRSHYRWYADTTPLDTGFHFNNVKNVFYQATRSGKVTLIAHANTACRDTMTKTFTIIVDTLSNAITFSDSVMCNSSNTILDVSFPKVEMDSVVWYRDGFPPPILPPLPIPKEFDWHYDNYHFGLGTHEIKIKVFRGSCIHTVTRNFELIGPLPVIQAIDYVQCVAARKVFLIENTQGSKREDCIFKWNIDDPYGDNCVHIQTQDSNLYMNCNKSEDYYIKHHFRKNYKETYIASLWVRDTVNGCEDSTLLPILMNNCGPILNPDTFHICGGRVFIDNANSPVPEFFTLDTGKNWFIFPLVIDTAYKGIYPLGFVFKTLVSPWAEDFGDDSIRLHSDTLTVRDTIYRNQKLWVHGPKEDEITFKEYGNCRPFRISIHFKNGWFDKDERLRIYGGTYFYDSVFTGPGHIDSIMFTFDQIGMSTEFQVRIENQWGCYQITKYFVEKGKTFNKYNSKFINCIYDSVCLHANVYDFKTHKYWPGNSDSNRVKWFYPRENRSDTAYHSCFKFKNSGIQPMQLIAMDSYGCIDTVYDTIFIQDIEANIKQSSKEIYCSELKQFFDSSLYLVNPFELKFMPFFIDHVLKYSWKFGDGVYSSFVKNPLQAFSSSLDSIPATHAIEMKSGCTDTFQFYIKLIGPKPYFTIKDTIGCGSLQAQFRNQSRFAKYYIWQFGDSLNTSLFKSTKDDVSFLYTEPGRYHIRLIGIDTVFNPYTMRMEPCHTVFPDPLFQKDSVRAVQVLPFLKTGISSLDTICLGSPLFLSSLSDPAYSSDYWDLGDSTEIDTFAPSQVSHTYKKQGSYLVKLKPSYSDSLRNTCRDSASKTVVVMGVQADFDIDPNIYPPEFQFYNQSTPLNAALNWDFGQPGSAGNQSSAPNPLKNYGKDTGHYSVCLIARIGFGCADTLCKIVFNDFQDAFGMYNVFTPGLADGLNDKYDILIENEALYDLKIYNRWGVLVYESEQDYDNAEANGNWNGQMLNTGEACPAGTYYYIFRYSLKNSAEKIETIEGVIHLIR